jgi:Fur family ferric uptake transcriptional regulator/Fur family peroxide stress response transcriptional regulator
MRCSIGVTYPLDKGKTILYNDNNSYSYLADLVLSKSGEDMSVLQDATLSLLKNTAGHFTAEQILRELRAADLSVSLATVYRTLGIFTAEGKIRRVSVSGGPKYYEGNILPHEHAVCLDCGKVSDLTLPGLADLVAAKLQGEIISTDLTVSYICRDCAEQRRLFSL